MTRTTTPSPPRRTRSHPKIGAVVVAGVLLTTACSEQDTTPTPDRPTNPATAGATPTRTPKAGELTASPAATPQPPDQGAPMDIRIAGAGDELRGSLDDTATARDFAALLPLTLTLDDFGGTEKIADLPRRLDTTGAPPAHTGRPGDITYFAPWGNLALFHGTGPAASGLIRLGSLAPGATEDLAHLTGTVTITLDSPPAPS